MIETPKTIIISDIDGVLADVASSTLIELWAAFHVPVCLEDWTQYDFAEPLGEIIGMRPRLLFGWCINHLWDNPKFWLHMRPYFAMHKALLAYQVAGGDLRFVTNRAANWRAEQIVKDASDVWLRYLDFQPVDGRMAQYVCGVEGKVNFCLGVASGFRGSEIIILEDNPKVVSALIDTFNERPDLQALIVLVERPWNAELPSQTTVLAPASVPEAQVVELINRRTDQLLEDHDE